jgi:hypothetical protein
MKKYLKQGVRGVIIKAAVCFAQKQQHEGGDGEEVSGKHDVRRRRNGALS